MRQAAFLSGGKSRINISGISDDFWRKSNWSVMALLKFRDIGQKFVRVLGHGTTVGNQGLHLGIVNGAKKVFVFGSTSYPGVFKCPGRCEQKKRPGYEVVFGLGICHSDF